ncbi:MAG: methyltransferase [Steroidobacteraceae bacterium]
MSERNQSASEAVAKAVADPARPAADRARDADRKPAELIALTGIHPGASIAEMLPGAGYFTRIFSKLAGPKGVVYAWVPAPPPTAPAGTRDMAAPMLALAASKDYPNIKVATLDPATPLPQPVDLVWTSLNYHDLHNQPEADLAASNRMVMTALKPGGLYMVIDHAAEKGSGMRDAATLHRIDPDLVRQEVTAAGFHFVMESNLLQHADDDHTKPSREVARGRTDQFVLLFQKPTS